MALGADDVQAAGLDDLPVQLGPLVLELARAAGELLLAHHAVLAQLVDLALHVAAEHDVGAAAGHVGGDGHGGRAAGLRDDHRLALVLLRVQHRMRDVRLLEVADSFSDVSIDVVPTSTGWPRFTQSRMSSMIASNLSDWFR